MGQIVKICRCLSQWEESRPPRN